MAIRGGPTSNKSPYGNLGVMLAEAAKGPIQENVKREALAKENESIKERFGIDLSGTTDPKTRLTILTEGLKGKNQTESFKNKAAFLGLGPQEPSQEPQEKPSSIYEEDLEPPEKKTKPFKVSDIPKEKRALLAITDPQTSKSLEHMADVEEREEREAATTKRKEFESDREYHSKRSDPIIEEAQNIVKNAPITKGLSQQSRRAVESGEVEGFAPFLISKLGIDPAMKPSMATFMSAQKHAFMEDLKGLAAGARPNQFLEKLLSSALPSVGKPKEANLAILDMDDFIRDMRVKRAEVELGLADEDFKKYGYAKADIGRRATEIMNDFIEESQDKLAYSIRNRHVESLSDDELAQEIVSGDVAPDQPLTTREATFIYLKNGGNLEAANKEIRQKGYKVLKKSSYGGI